MKKLVLILLMMLSLTACSTSQPHSRYITQGRYYTNGTVVTTDGNEWLYSTDSISDKTPHDAMPINVAFDDNGTPNNIYDDIILGVTWDITTNIYDDLEAALSDKFEVERDGNYIHISNGITQ